MSRAAMNGSTGWDVLLPDATLIWSSREPGWGPSFPRDNSRFFEGAEIRPCLGPARGHTSRMLRILLAAIALTFLAGCKFDPEKAMAKCTKAHPGDDDAIAVCFSNAQRGREAGIGGMSATGDEK
jgi:hypothetical protein